ncbi:MAG: hypothetical protein RLZZ65_167 [Bacteroidota bacterium]|jgi:hypothetical protein
MRCFLLFVIILLSFSLEFKAQNQLVSSGQFFEGEPYLAIDPQNPQHLVAAWMGFQFNEKIVIKTSVSSNGGTTWSTPTALPHQQMGNSSADVSLAYDLQGNLYIAYIDYDNVGFTNGAIICRKSVNSGLNWGAAVVVRPISSCPNKLCIDRPWIAVDPLTGSIVVTSVNANQPALVQAPYHPYMAISSDQGQSFSLSELDAAPYLSGSALSQPLASPAFSNDGTFSALYLSYEPTQSILPRVIEVSKTAPASFYSYSVAFQGLGLGSQNDSLKKGPHLSVSPNNSTKAYTFITEVFGDPDIAIIEKINGSWSAPQRINNDAQGNGALQDLAWSDYDTDGDLAVCWRDRRNGTANTYESPTEIACRIKTGNTWQDEIFMSPQVAHDSILLENGNDFLNVQFENNLLYTIWGDVRSGSLKIYINKYDQQDSTNQVSLIANESVLYPNPCLNYLNVPSNFSNQQFEIYNLEGKTMLTGQIDPQGQIDLTPLEKGSYLIKIGALKEVFIKN